MNNRPDSPIALGAGNFVASANGRLCSVSCLVSGVMDLGPVGSLDPQPPGFTPLDALLIIASFTAGALAEHLHYFFQ